MDLSNVDETVKSFVDLGTTIGEFAIQLLEGAQVKLKLPLLET